MKQLPAKVTSEQIAKQQPPVMAAGRSVKSIVAWLESPKDEGYSVITRPDIRLSSTTTTTTTTTTTVTERRLGSFSRAPVEADDEQDSLTLLNYRDFFAQRPLARCLDGVTEDLSKLSLDEVFARAGRTERAVVTVVSGGKPSKEAVVEEVVSGEVQASEAF
ncbi:hypothetical protein CDD80_5168 [Ophiocordyceps camponoti-rufipedis]|uniref:Uncharacterized protein n=1 Tax=Ophiocordyceps camponoti-rufipedis TaxID=2004952 RepID=A0A2C5YS91_9HYPO|nr:hypothetical protein CDD80_5168 [Ophiocordyceps camponoti-rufipedis]